MSHIVRVQTKLHDPDAIAAACRRLGLAAPVHGTAKLYSGEATGLLVQLPDWLYPVVIDTTSGTVQFDDYEGSWGDRADLNRLFQMYAVERTRLECRKKNYTVTESALADGSIKLHIQEGA